VRRAANLGRSRLFGRLEPAESRLRAELPALHALPAIPRRSRRQCRVSRSISSSHPSAYPKARFTSRCRDGASAPARESSHWRATVRMLSKLAAHDEGSPSCRRTLTRGAANPGCKPAFQPAWTRWKARPHAELPARQAIPSAKLTHYLPSIVLCSGPIVGVQAGIGPFAVGLAHGIILRSADRLSNRLPDKLRSLSSSGSNAVQRLQRVLVHLDQERLHTVHPHQVSPGAKCARATSGFSSMPYPGLS
jgi:hypothetical protein